VKAGVDSKFRSAIMPKYSTTDHRMPRSVGWRPEEPAERANDHIVFSRGTSNSNLVTSDAGDVVINTGTPFEGARTRERYEQLLGRPLKVHTIIFTQFHSDHVSGWSDFMGPGVITLAHRELPRLRKEWLALRDYYQPRGARFLSGMMPKPEQVKAYFRQTREPEGMTLLGDSHSFDVGGRRFELHAVNSGETLDGLIVWLPAEKTLFTGNFMGALYGALPHFSTIRGDRARSVPTFLKDIQRLIDFGAELLLTGHDAPIVGRERIRADLTKLRDAVRYIHDETIKGMNAHKDLHTLMREIKLPEHLSPAPGRGPVHWYVRAVWEEYSGWFMQQSTTELYGVPHRAIWDELTGLAGGTDKLAQAARRHAADGRPLEALHFTDIALSVDPEHRLSLETKIAALETLIDRSGGTNFDELGWLESEINSAKSALRAS
jgi:alkyl sulfatase BDS1-like metallo-beta-lactamase superfamily hydrolase